LIVDIILSIRNYPIVSSFFPANIDEIDEYDLLGFWKNNKSR